jgi:hypothetical protein
MQRRRLSLSPLEAQHCKVLSHRILKRDNVAVEAFAITASSITVKNAPKAQHKNRRAVYQQTLRCAYSGFTTTVLGQLLDGTPNNPRLTSPAVDLAQRRLPAEHSDPVRNAATRHRYGILYVFDRIVASDSLQVKHILYLGKFLQKKPLHIFSVRRFPT